MYALAFGIGTKNRNDEWLEVYFPRPAFRPNQALVHGIAAVTGYKGGNNDIELNADQLRELADTITDERQNSVVAQMASSTKPVVLTMIESDDSLQSTPETYLKLHLLSHRCVLPNEQNLEGIYPLLPNVAWTEQGAVDLNEIEERQFKARLEGQVLEVSAVDKFPKMTNYVIPSGTRIAHSARVRLGAYVGEGTTVMHELSLIHI